MKHILLLFTFPFFLLSGAQKDPNMLAEVQVELTFGRAPNCSMRGTCTMGRADEKPPIGAGMAWGQLRIDETDRLALEIQKTDILQATADQQFEDGLFEESTNFLLPEDILDALQPSFSNSYIAPGNYQVEENSTHYLIRF